MVSNWTIAITAGLLLPVVYLLFQSSHPAAPKLKPPSKEQKPVKSIMQPPRTDLAPPKDDKFTLEDLKKYDGSNPDLPIYIGIKGTVFDVTHKKDVYGPGKSYGIFAGKDASMGFGMSSLKLQHAQPDYSGLAPNERKVLEDWHSFFRKRYNVVGVVIDHPNGIVPLD